MKMKKILSAVLAAMLIMACLTGCGGTETGGDGNAKLKWILLGPGIQKDSDEVYAAFNEKLQEYMPGTTVEFEVLIGSEFQEKWNLMMATNETVDIAWSGYAVDFTKQMQQGSYLALDELIAQYGQDMVAELPEWVFDLTKVEGKIYAVPCYQMMSAWPRGIFLTKENSDKYFDRQAIIDKYEEWKKDDSKGKEFYATIADGLEKMKQAGVIGNGISSTVGSFKNDPFFEATSVSGFSIDPDKDEIIVDCKWENTKLWYEIAADWYKKGYIRNDILSVQDQGSEPHKNGYIMWTHNYSDKTAEIKSNDLGVEIDVIPLGANDYVIRNAMPSTMLTIPRTSKNPEKAMQLINLMNSEKGKELYNLLVWGIEGKHYTKISDTRIKTVYEKTQATSDDAYGLFNWAVGNTKNSYEPHLQMEGWADYQISLDEKATPSKYIGFKPDTSMLSTEIAQTSAVATEYVNVLKYGAVDNWEELYDEYVKKYDAAGAEKIRAELQKQLDEWLKKNNK
jgi:putative aldouronate transport system substrate-binding protein